MTLAIFNNSISGINAAMTNIQIAGHNIANVDTEGYSRQQSIALNKAPIRTAYGSIQIGQGVEIQSVTRIRNEYLDEEFRKSNENVGFYEIMSEGYLNIENLFGEPSETSLSSNINNFWNSLSELSKNPEFIAERNVFIEASMQMINNFKSITSNLDTLMKNYNSSIDSTVSSINSLFSQIHTLNEDILKSEALGSEASDLRDQRDLLIDKLSSFVNIEVSDDSRGSKLISIGGSLIVGEGIHKTIYAERNNLTNKIEFTAGEASSIPLNINNGKLAGLVDMTENVIPNIKDKINSLLSSIANEFNATHKKGFGLDGTTGLDFFISTDGGTITIDNIAINQEILDNPSKFAASTSANYSGDNTNILNLLNLKDQTLIEISPGVNITFADYYNNLITGIGIQSNNSSKLLNTYINTSNVADLNRMSVSGVNLDEELTNISAYQHAYNANARMVQVLDEMLTTLIDIF